MSGIQLVYAERDIEDLLAEDCQHYLGLTFIARQVKTPVGIADILARNDDGLHFVIEIKRGVLDASAYVQVMRYARYLNSERSKDGGRLFVPLLIGSNLSDDLITLCDYFEPDIGRSCSHIATAYYRLFEFDPKTGVSFTWNSIPQAKHKESLAVNFSHIEALEDNVSQLDWRLSTLMSEWPADRDAHIRLVRPNDSPDSTSPAEFMTMDG